MPRRVKEGSGATGRDRLTYVMAEETTDDMAQLERYLSTGWLVDFSELGVLEMALNLILDEQGISFAAMSDAREINEKSVARFEVLPDVHIARSVIRSKGFDHDSPAGYALELLFRFRKTRDLIAAGNVQTALLEAVQIGLALQEAHMKDWADSGFVSSKGGKKGRIARQARNRPRNLSIARRYRELVPGAPRRGELIGVYEMLAEEFALTPERVADILRELPAEDWRSLGLIPPS